MGPKEARVNPLQSEMNNKAIEPVVKKYDELRYQLMPYTYTLAWEARTLGMPLMRALWLHYPNDTNATKAADEFLWGRDILVAPVTEKGATSRQLYLPRGVWYDWWTGEKIEGGREIERGVDLTTMPLYVRAGAIIPLAPVKQYTGEKVDGPLTLQVYRGADGQFLLYEDDGSTFNFRKGEWMGIQMAWNDRRRSLTLRLAEGSRMLPPIRRKIEVRLVAENITRAIVFDGRPARVQF